MSSMTFNNPKEMLGYKIIEDLRTAPDILKASPYDRKACYAYYYLLRHLHAQMVSFHNDMFILEPNEKGEIIRYEHDQVYPLIIQEVQNNWGTVFLNQQDKLLEVLFKFAELLSSSFPKLGLVPETGTSIKEEERVIDPKQDELEEPFNEPVQPTASSPKAIASGPTLGTNEPVQQPATRKPTGYRFT